MVDTGEQPAKDDAPASKGLLDLALELAKKLSSAQAMIVLLVVVTGLVIVQLAAKPGSGGAIWAVVALLVVGEAAALLLHRLDSPAAKGLTDTDRDGVNAALVNIRNDVATRLGCDRSHCRANIFGETTLGRLQIVRPFMVNMDNVTEWRISIQKGRGATGIAWSTAQPKVIVAPFAGDEDLDPADAALVDPDLEWIVSVPVEVDGSVKWVVNVDGSDPRSKDDLEPAVREVRDSVPTLQAFAARA